MKFQLFKRLVAEDFPPESQSTIQRISTVFNPLVDELNTGLNKRLDFNNLNQQVVTFNVTTDSSGSLITPITLTSTLTTSVQGTLVINVINNTDNAGLAGAPFCTWTRTSGKIVVNQITGLLGGRTYTITMILIG